MREVYLEYCTSGRVFCFLNVNRECEAGYFLKVNYTLAVNLDTREFFKLRSKNGPKALNYTRVVQEYTGKGRDEILGKFYGEMRRDYGWVDEILIKDVIKPYYSNVEIKFRNNVDRLSTEAIVDSELVYNSKNFIQDDSQVFEFNFLGQNFSLEKKHLTSEYVSSLVLFLKFHLRYGNED